MAAVITVVAWLLVGFSLGIIALSMALHDRRLK